MSQTCNWIAIDAHDQIAVFVGAAPPSIVELSEIGVDQPSVDELTICYLEEYFIDVVGVRCLAKEPAVSPSAFHVANSSPLAMGHWNSLRRFCEAGLFVYRSPAPNQGDAYCQVFAPEKPFAGKFLPRFLAVRQLIFIEMEFESDRRLQFRDIGTHTRVEKRSHPLMTSSIDSWSPEDVVE